MFCIILDVIAAGAVIAGSLVVALGVDAKTQQETKYRIGFGRLSCASWTVARRTFVQTPSYEQWVLGYIVGFAEGSHRDDIDPLRGMDEQKVWAWVDNYCQTHSLEPVANAAAQFIIAHPH